MSLEEIAEFSNTYFFLSNFYPSEIEFEGKIYPTVEHAFQAAKTTDKSLREEIANSTTPGRAKRLGKKLLPRNDWSEVKIPIMKTLLLKKFCDVALRDQLIRTGSAELIEGNLWNDTFWGCVKEGSGWKGENHLGCLLMEIRSGLITK